MKSLILNAFYDMMAYQVGDILIYIFLFLMVIELIYVMVKYLGSKDK
jgi:hypothetical protein